LISPPANLGCGQYLVSISPYSEIGSLSSQTPCSMKLATYNVNGVNGRLPVLLRWLEQSEPDVVCLQELKAPKINFRPLQLRKQATAQSGTARSRSVGSRMHCSFLSRALLIKSSLR
jgi:hypothetical protein